MSDCDNVMSICYGNQLGILASLLPSPPACLPAAKQSSHKGGRIRINNCFLQVSTFHEHCAARQPSTLTPQHEHHPQHEHPLSPHVGFGGSHYLPGFLGLGRTQCGSRTSASAVNQGERASERSSECRFGDEARVRDLGRSHRDGMDSRKGLVSDDSLMHAIL